MRPRAFFSSLSLACVVAGLLVQAEDITDSLWGDRYRERDDRESGIPAFDTATLEDFESPTAEAWRTIIPYDDGIAESKIVSAAEPAGGRSLGVRVSFMRRHHSRLDLRPAMPVRISDSCVGFSIRAYGSGFPHELRLLVLDYYGNEFELSFGSLAFTGWRRLESFLPRRDGVSFYVQDDRHYRDPEGLRISGLRIVFGLEESYGQYIAYFDDLRAIVAREEGPSAFGSDEAHQRKTASPSLRTSGGNADEELRNSAQDRMETARIRVLSEIEKKIADLLVYPEAARLRGIEGGMILSFKVSADGRLVDLVIAKSSGSEILDRAGVELLPRVFPVENDSGLELELQVPIVFRLTDAPRD
jgi:TonB family protein